MEVMKALILTITELNLVSQSVSSLLYCLIYGTLCKYKQFLVPFIDSSSRSEEKYIKFHRMNRKKPESESLFL